MLLSVEAASDACPDGPADADGDILPPESHSARRRNATVSCRSCCRPSASLPNAFIGGALVVGPVGGAWAALACFAYGVPGLKVNGESDSADFGRQALGSDWPQQVSQLALVGFHAGPIFSGH
uniref:Uncharacterized protein n=1 Tax=Anopheles atroparvus TaxID=41427 RepID=A0A182JG79_ANOAO